MDFVQFEGPGLEYVGSDFLSAVGQYVLPEAQFLVIRIGFLKFGMLRYPCI
jgi:hypothetical protein